MPTSSSRPSRHCSGPRGNKAPVASSRAELSQHRTEDSLRSHVTQRLATLGHLEMVEDKRQWQPVSAPQWDQGSPGPALQRTPSAFIAKALIADPALLSLASTAVHTSGVRPWSPRSQEPRPCNGLRAWILPCLLSLACTIGFT